MLRPWTRNWRNYVVGNINGFRLPRWGYGKFEGFWPKKAWENPRGKVNFSLGIIPWLSPDAKHPGWRLRRRARSTTAPSSSSAFLSATVETNLIPSVKQYPLNGSRGRSPLVRGYGGRTGPCFVSLSELKCHLLNPTEQLPFHILFIQQESTLGFHPRNTE